MMILVGMDVGTSLKKPERTVGPPAFSSACWRMMIICSRKAVRREAFFERNRWRDERKKGAEKNTEDINKMRRGNELARDKKIRGKNDMREK